MGNKYIANNCRIQAYHSIMCEYFYIGFIKRLTDFTSFCWLNSFKKNKVLDFS